MAKIFDSRLNSILKMEVTSLLKDLGFRKKQLIYACPVDGLSWLIDIQKSQWNDQEEAHFTVNCGVYVPGVLSIYANMSEPSTPKIEHCSFSVRIGMLIPEKKDLWWRLAVNDFESTDSEIAQDLRSKIENVILPFLGKFKSVMDVAAFLSSDLGDKYAQVAPVTTAQRLAYSAIIYSKVGNSTKAKKILNMAIESAKKSPIENIISGLKLR